MNYDATKYFSGKQEKLVAEYLGWTTVSGSGARNFHPGDIRSCNYLGECKTHVKPIDKLFFSCSVWAKIKNEATSVFKTPILITDIGTQKLDDTWCIVPKTAVFRSSINVLSVESALPNLKIGQRNININISLLDNIDKLTECISIKWNDEDVILLHIFAFKSLLELEV